jgi:EpsI family protein
VAAGASPSASSGRQIAAVVCATHAAIGWPVAHAALAEPFGRPGPVAVTLDSVNGWQPSPAFAQWHPITQKPSLEKTAHFIKDGAVIGVQLSVYRDQAEGAELVSWGNQLIDESPEATSRVVAQRKVAAAGSLAAPGYRETVLQADKRLVVRDWYWLGDHTTTSDAAAKVSLALDRLLRRDDTSAWVLIFTPVREDAAEAQSRLNAFQREMGPSIQAALEGLRR